MKKRRQGDTSKRHLENTTEPVAETVLDENADAVTSAARRSANVGVGRRATADAGGHAWGSRHNTAESTTDNFVWFEFGSEPLGARALANHLSKLSNCKRRRMPGV